MSYLKICRSFVIFKGFLHFISDFKIKFWPILVDFYGIVVDSSEFSSYVDDFLQIFGDLMMNSGPKIGAYVHFWTHLKAVYVSKTKSNSS